MKAVAAVLLAGLCALAGAQPVPGMPPGERPPLPPAPPGVLRVCADPDNLPQAHHDGSGFEDRLARLLARELGLDLQYAWLPDRRGFVRKTLGAGQCDVLMGVPAGDERVRTTRPYYRSTYVWLQRADAGPPLGGFDDPRLARWRIGLPLAGDDMAAVPPGHALARHVPQATVVGFPLAGEQPVAQRIGQALEDGTLDGAFLWGPQAGWVAARSAVPLRLVRIAAPADLPAGQAFDFAIAVGVRKDDAALRERLQAALDRRRAEVRQLLLSAGVPLVEDAR